MLQKNIIEVMCFPFTSGRLRFIVNKRFQANRVLAIGECIFGIISLKHFQFAHYKVSKINFNLLSIFAALLIGKPGLHQ